MIVFTALAVNFFRAYRRLSLLVGISNQYFIAHRWVGKLDKFGNRLFWCGIAIRAHIMSMGARRIVIWRVNQSPNQLIFFIECFFIHNLVICIQNKFPTAFAQECTFCIQIDSCICLDIMLCRAFSCGIDRYHGMHRIVTALADEQIWNTTMLHLLLAEFTYTVRQAISFSVFVVINLVFPYIAVQIPPNAAYQCSNNYCGSSAHA